MNLPTCVSLAEFSQIFGSPSIGIGVGQTGRIINRDGELIVEWAVREGPDGIPYVELSDDGPYAVGRWRD